MNFFLKYWKLIFALTLCISLCATGVGLFVGLPLALWLTFATVFGTTSLLSLIIGVSKSPRSPSPSPSDLSSKNAKAAQLFRTEEELKVKESELQLKCHNLNIKIQKEIQEVEHGDSGNIHQREEKLGDERHELFKELELITKALEHLQDLRRNTSTRVKNNFFQQHHDLEKEGEELRMRKAALSEEKRQLGLSLSQMEQEQRESRNGGGY